MENKQEITVELSKEQYEFLVNWQKSHEAELGIDVPLSSMVRKAVDGAMKAQSKRSEDGPRKFGDKPSFGDRGSRPPRSGDRPERSGGFGGRSDRGGDRPARSGGFGDRKPMGRGRPSGFKPNIFAGKNPVERKFGK